MGKTRLSVNLDDDIYDKLKLISEEQHLTMTSVITQWIIKTKVKGEIQIRGQQKIKD